MKKIKEKKEQNKYIIYRRQLYLPKELYFEILKDAHEIYTSLPKFIELIYMFYKNNKKK